MKPEVSPERAYLQLVSHLLTDFEFDPQDLDSLASAVGYATLATKLQSKNTIPFVMSYAEQVELRPENQLALSLAGVSNSNLLHIDQLPVPTSELASLGVKFALVDHNSLLAPFHPQDGQQVDGLVEAIVDHHADDGQHPSASPRIIQIPTGSASSLVTMYFQDLWTRQEDSVPPELATLLLTAVLVDTGGLKAGSGSKTTETDRQAAEFYWKIEGNRIDNGFADSSALAKGEVPTESVTAAGLEEGKYPTAIKSLTDRLLEAKFDVSGLSSYQLLMRDYKEYELETSLSSGHKVRMGLSTVPMALSEWLTREQSKGWASVLDSVDEWMSERDLAIEGVLTSFKTEPTEAKPRGKGKREIVLIVKSTETFPRDEAARLYEKLVQEMSAAQETLKLKDWPSKTDAARLPREIVDTTLVLGDAAPGGLNSQGDKWGQVWRQGNAHATRKQVQPLMVSLLMCCWGKLSHVDGGLPFWVSCLQKDIIAKFD